MNKVVLVGRLAQDPEVRTTAGENPITIANFSLAVDRPRAKEGQQSADFIRCVVFGKRAEFVRDYLKKGTRIALAGHIQTGSYEKDGVKHYTTDINVDDIEFAQSKSEGGAASAPAQAQTEEPADGFVESGVDEELPFN